MGFVQREYLFKVSNQVMSYGITCDNGNVTMGISIFDFDDFMSSLKNGSEKFCEYISFNGFSSCESYDKKEFIRKLATLNGYGEYIGRIDYASDNLKIMK